MKKLLLWIFIVSISMIAVSSLSCGSNLEQGEVSQAETEQIEILVSKSIKEAIAEAAPSGEYCFYALKESYPKNIKEINKVKLFICGEVETDTGLKVVEASLDDLLFKSIHEYSIDPNAISGSMKQSQTLSITLESDEVVEILYERSFYGTDKSIEDIVNICVEEMQKGTKNILLMSRDIENDVLNQMVEIVFKEQ